MLTRLRGGALFAFLLPIIKMEKLNYNSDSHSEEVKETPTLAPAVYVEDLVQAKANHELQRFERETAIDREQNHLTGFLQTNDLSRGKFLDQYHSF